MTKSLKKALFAAITVALGINVAMLLKGEGFPLWQTGLYTSVTFVVDFLFSLLFGRKKG